jgi:hypothetical protein
LTYNTSTTPSTGAGAILFADDTKVEQAPVNEILTTALQGDIDETRKDFMIKLSGTPLVYPAGQAGLLGWLFPWANGVPAVGGSLCGATDTPSTFLASNGDMIVIYNSCVAKMPDLILEIGKPILGPLEVLGLIRNGFDPETASSYYAKSASNAYTPPTLAQQSGDSLGRQRYYGNWAAGNTAAGNSDFTNFQGQAGWTISHELKLDPVIVQGRTVDFTLLSYRALAKCVPVGPTAADIEACMQNQGTGAKAGSRLSANTATGDLIITGQNNFTATIKNAVLKTAGFMFGGKPLRIGEVGWVGTFNLSTTTPTGGLNLA